MSTTAHDAGPPKARQAATGEHTRRTLILAVIAISQLMLTLDTTVVNISLPSAQQDLGFSTDNRQWIVTAYSLAFGGLLLVGGRIGDLVGRKATLLIGLAGFACASALGGAAPNFETLVVGRALQGVFGALLAPSVLALLTTTFTDAKERARAFGIFGAVAGAGAGVGLILGGALTEYLDWRWCMYINLVFAAVALVGAAVLLPRQGRTKNVKIDFPGAVTVTTGLFALVYGCANAETLGWGAAGTWGSLAAGAVLIAVFARLQARGAHPLLPLRILLDRNRGAALVTIFTSSIGMFGLNLFLTYYLQQTLGYSPVRTGLAFLPMTCSIMLTSTTFASFLVPRCSPKLIVPCGMALSAAALVWLTGLRADSGYATGILPPLVLFGIGTGLTISTAMSAATTGVDPGDSGVGSAAVTTMQQVGGSIGTALLSTLAAGAATGYLASHRATEEALTQSALHSYSTAFGWSAAFYAAGLVVCGLLFRRGAPDRAPS